MKSRLLTWIEYIPIRIILFFVRLLPYRLAVKIGGFLGRFIYYIPSLKKTVNQGLNIAYANEKTPLEIKKTAKNVFIHFGKICFEVMKMLSFKPKHVVRHVEFVNKEQFLKDYNQGKGMILICCHLGNWELLGAGWSHAGIHADVIVRPLDNVLLDKYVERMRESFGMRVIPRKEVFKKGKDTIKQSRALVFLMDQNTVTNPLFVPFFGKEASTVTGPAIFARKYNCPVGFAYSVRINNSLHRLYYEPIEIDRTIDDRKEFIRIHTEKFSRYIEEAVRKHPEQWLWLHPRWKTRPPDELNK